VHSNSQRIIAAWLHFLRDVKKRVRLNKSAMT